MDEILIKIVGELVRAVPVIIFLIYAIKYFKNKILNMEKIIKDKDDHIQELNDSWRKSSDDSLKIISKLGNSIDKFAILNGVNKDEILNELEHLKELLNKKHE